MKPKTEAELTSAQWHYIHVYRNVRAMARRRAITPKYRSELEELMARLEHQAREEGVPEHLMRQWREYPRTLRFGHRATVDGDRLTVENTSPGRRERKTLPPAPSSDPGELLELLERSLAEQMRKR